MAEVKYNFLGDNFFTTYQSVEPATKYTTALGDVIDIGDWGYIGDDGKIYANNNTGSKNEKTSPKMIVDNTEEIPISTTSSRKQNPNLTSRKKQAMEFFQAKGLSAHQAAGIIGNLIQESKLDTKASGDNGKAFGLAQWHPDRQKGLKALAQSRGKDISDFETQLEYVWQELNTTEKKALNALLNSKDVKQATSAFVLFERPGDIQLNKRIKFAESLLS